MGNKKLNLDSFLKNSQLVLDWPKGSMRRRKRLSEFGGQTIGVYDGYLKKTIVGRVEANGNNDCSYSFRKANSKENYHLCYAHLEKVFTE